VSRLVRRETGDQTDQESRSAGPRAAPSVTAMDITIHTSYLPHDDPDASLAFYRDTLGFEVRNDVGNGKMRWITVGPADQPGTSILLAPPAADPGVTDDERRTIVEMMAKGTYGWILLATADLNGTFEKLQASDAEVVQEPTEQPYGVRDCAFRDPAGNLIRIQELR
jgi:catechol 2,3-dioxygenase-like lactoylglutathione lyase family enzyme